MIEIDRIEPTYSVSLYGGELTLKFQFVDIEGTVRNAVISSFAVRDLASKLHDCHDVLLDQLVDRDKAHTFKISQGPTRDEVYLPEGEL